MGMRDIENITLGVPINTTAENIEKTSSER